MPKISQSKGFTLIELLVVIALIAILSVVSVTLYSKVTSGARDSRRKADIEAIAKAYEVQKGTGYIALQDSHFASGKKPTDPSKGEYFNYLASDGSGYKVCAALDNNPSDACNTPALNCYCKTSVQATINPSSPYDPSSTQYLLGLGGSSDSSCDPNGTLLSGLVGYWKMDETTNWNSTPGEVRDSSGNGNNGTAYGGANITQHTPDPTGVFKNAGNFNGSSGYIELGNPSLFNSNFTELTVSAWFKSNIWSNEYPSPDYSMDVLVSKWDRQAGNIDVGFRFERTYGGCCFGIWVSSGTDMGANQAQVPIGSVSTGVWHHAVGTFKGGNFVRLYLDGGLINEQTSGIYPQVTAATLQNLRIGVMSHGYGFFNGLIDDVRIYNRALSGDSPDSEITHLYNGGDGCAP